MGCRLDTFFELAVMNSERETGGLRAAFFLLALGLGTNPSGSTQFNPQENLHGA